MKTLISLVLAVSFFSSIPFSGPFLGEPPAALAAKPTVPDFTVQIGQDPYAKMRGWLLNFLPPPGHHFNIEAPMKVTGLDDQVTLTKVGAAPDHIGYRSSDPKLKDKSSIDASFFLCDDAKTFCIKKTVNFQLIVNSDLTKLEFPKSKESKPSAPAKSGKKDASGFWDNNLNAALAESAKTKKPILVDFYGIWCPPCNMYEETVFPRAKFKTATAKWVLLKMDADRSPSFELKSHFKVQAYPTFVGIMPPSGASERAPDLAEIDRVVGFFPIDEFTEQLNTIYNSRNFGIDDKIAFQRSTYLRTIRQKLKDIIPQGIDDAQTAEAISLSEDGEKLSPMDDFFKISGWSLKAITHPELLKDSKADELIKTIWTNREKEAPETLLKVIDILTSHSDQFSKSEIAWANDLLDQLAKMVQADTLSVPGVELSIADIDSLRADVAEALGDTDLQKKSYEQAVASYQKMMHQFHAEGSRGYNLEMAYALWKSGKVEEAKAVYRNFIQHYPREFTFYFAASKMYLELKDYGPARSYAENAFQFAYGDNKLRAIERLVRVLIAKGEAAQGLKRGSDYLQTLERPDPSLNVRTTRYIKALEKAVQDAEKASASATPAPNPAGGETEKTSP